MDPVAIAVCAFSTAVAAFSYYVSAKLSRELAEVRAEYLALKDLRDQECLERIEADAERAFDVYYSNDVTV